jgi:hypothetical protein
VEKMWYDFHNKRPHLHLPFYQNSVLMIACTQKFRTVDLTKIHFRNTKSNQFRWCGSSKVFSLKVTISMFTLIKYEINFILRRVRDDNSWLMLNKHKKETQLFEKKLISFHFVSFC